MSESKIFKPNTTLKSEVYNEWDKLRLNISLAEVFTRNSTKVFLEGFGITQQQYHILLILKQANNEPISTKEIASMMIEKNSDTSRLVDRLIDKNLVRKRKSIKDGRLVQVYIKYEGLALLSKIQENFHVLDAKFNHISSEERDQLNRLLEKVYS